MTAPNPRTWVDKEIPDYSMFNTEVYRTVAWLLQPPMVKLRQTTAQTVPTATYTTLTWQAEDIDPLNWHNATNPSRVTPTIPGWYRGTYGIGMTSATGGAYRLGIVAKNGVAVRSRHDSKAPIGTGTTKSIRGVPFFVSCNGTTDYIEIMAYHDVGSSMVLNVTATVFSEVFMRYWAPL